MCDAAARLPERLKHETQVLLVVEMPEEAKAVELVIRVGVVQLLEELQLFQTRLLPVRRLFWLANELNTYVFVAGWAGKTRISSLFRMILTATSWPALAVSLARITLLNTPWPV